MYRGRTIAARALLSHPAVHTEGLLYERRWTSRCLHSHAAPSAVLCSLGSDGGGVEGSLSAKGTGIDWFGCLDRVWLSSAALPDGVGFCLHGVEQDIGFWKHFVQRDLIVALNLIA